MPGPHRQLTPQQARKQLLLVESEVNRAQLQAEFEGLSQHVRGLAAEFNSVASFASSIMSGFKSIRSLWSEPGGAGTSWRSRLGRVFQAGINLWDAFRSKKPT